MHPSGKIWKTQSIISQQIQRIHESKSAQLSDQELEDIERCIQNGKQQIQTLRRELGIMASNLKYVYETFINSDRRKSSNFCGARDDHMYQLELAMSRFKVLNQHLDFDQEPNDIGDS
jgi:hypothetical protein